MLRIVQHLDPHKFEHVVLCPSEKDGIIAELGQCSNCTVHAMSFRSFRNVINLILLVRFINQGHFDLIHSHGKAAGIYSRIVGKILRVPVIHQLHGLHYKHYPKPLQFFYQKIEAMLSRWSNKIICVSESERNEGLALGIFKKEQTVVIHNGVDVTQFKPIPELQTKLRKEWGIPPDAKVIVSITRNCFQKNPEFSLRVHAVLCQTFPDLYLFLIGIPVNSDNIVSLAKQLGTEKRVILTEKQQNMSQLLNIGTVYLNCSRWEGLSVGIIEAMATELPVILSNVIGNEEFLAKPQNGMHFVGDGAISSYTQIIEKILNNISLSKHLGRQARTDAITRFNLIEKMEEIEKEYQSILNYSRAFPIVNRLPHRN